MRIGIIAHLKHPIGEPFCGGLETHTHLLARGLRRRGHEVTVFASDGSDPAVGVEPICEDMAIREVGLAEATNVAFFREHHAYLRLMNELRRRDFDIVHNNSIHYLPVAMADALTMPMVTTLHTPPFCWLESGVRLCRSSRSTFVTVSDALRRFWSPIAPVRGVVLNGIDLDRFRFQKQPADEPYLAWSGRIVPEKGLHLAIEAARIVGMPLRIAGPVADSAYFEREIRPLLGDGASHLGHLAHSELAAVVGGARALLFTPRWEEPYGLVAAEALACGTPVAAFARGAIAEVVDETCGVLAAPDDAADLAEAARKALSLDRRACRLRAEHHCDAKLMVSVYERLYGRILAGNVQPDPAPATLVAAE
ncbi:glycosyltransferase family 4 protein [Hansschlegelia zhihuaiae]|uniref:Glycosyltransferase family 4 protein n=1 Tax=Hansschlegelia zhihuaiae TaxID=405005 RepID=A0A4Q0M4P8_9HYPH|nr:glycosyltransferase family 4 protein [Hansschlegelia zhihuaiae]RXF67941.1 glycosyltransferase family 4 protein [Hansschlegelia zhihuaiae]